MRIGVANVILHSAPASGLFLREYLVPDGAVRTRFFGSWESNSPTVKRLKFRFKNFKATPPPSEHALESARMPGHARDTHELRRH